MSSTGSQEIAILKGTLLASLKYDSIYSSMRVYIANALHILQMFYSNTNWVEMKGAEINKDLGKLSNNHYDNNNNNAIKTNYIKARIDNVVYYLPIPPLGQDMTQGQFLSGV